MSWWRQALFAEIFQNGLDVSSTHRAEQTKTDQLFRNKVARRTFRKLLKFSVASSLEAIILLLIRFDTIVSDAADSGANNIDGMHTIQASLTDTDKIRQMSQKPDRQYSVGVALRPRKV